MDEVEENEAASTEENGTSAAAEAQTLLTRDNLRRFEKMVTASLFKSHFEMADEAIRARLNVQFRMHPQIMAMVNHFYEGSWNVASFGLTTIQTRSFAVFTD